MKWKRLISGLCAVCVAVTGSFLMLPGDVLDSAILAQAAEIIGEGTCGDHLTWTLDSEGTVTVSGTGYMDDNGRYNNKAWRKYGCINSVRRVIIEDGVTSIGAEAFYQCTNLTEISIPESVKSISYNVFKECTGLKEINIPEGVQSIGSNAFNGCTQLTKVILSDSVTSIGAWAFWECKELKSISLPKHLTWIPGCMFSSCTSLAEITIPEGVTAIGDYAFSGCTGLAEITIPDSVKSIGEQAFSGCSSLQSIKIPDSVTRIGTKAFSGCTSLAEITIPDSVTSIGENAFENTPWLAEAPFIITNGILVSAPNSAGSVTVPEGVTAIGESAFANCTDLTEVILPDSVTSIGKKAFSGCTGLAEITLPEGLTSIGESAFSDCKNLTSISLPESLTAIEIHAFENCRRLKEITIPEGITALSDYTFQNCINLTQIHLPDTLKSIGFSAFSGCRKITSISLPESVTTIWNQAFAGCTSLAEITLPDNVTSIGASAFAGCTGLTEITIPEGVTTLAAYTFAECSNLQQVHLPDSLKIIGKEITERYAMPVFDGCSKLKSITVPKNVQTIYAKALLNCGLKEITILSENCKIGTMNFGEYSYEKFTPTEITIYGYENSTAQAYAASNVSCSFRAIDSEALSGYGWILSGDGVLHLLKKSSYENYDTHYKDYADKIWKIVIESDVKSFPSNAFSGFSNVTDVTIEDGVKTIGGFSNCTGLTQITFPESLTGIGWYAFSGCTGLTEITIPKGVTSIGDSAFSGCKYIKSVSLPDSLTAIGQYAFDNCRRLKEITIPEGITALSSYTFQNCINLTQIHLPDTLKSIGQGAFFGCRKLTDISLPESVTSIGESAFSGCTGVTDITVLNKDCDISYTIDAIPEQAVIHGYSGSTAQTYAQMYGRTFISLDGSSGEENPPEPKEYYPLTVCGIPVTDVNKDDILGNGVFKYLPQSSLLVVGGTVSVSGTVIEATGSLSVYVQNFSRLTSTEQDAIVLHGDGGKVTITGSNPLTLSAPNGAGIRLGENTTLSLLSTNITIEDADCGILGTEKNADLQITHCGVSFKKIKTCAASVSGEILLSYNKKNDAVGIVRREDGVCFYDQTNDCPAADFDILRLPFPNLYDDDEYDYSGEDGYIEVYPVSIGGIHVTEANCSDVLGNGVFRYDPDSDVLTVSGDVHCIDVGFQCIKNRRSVEMRIEKDSVLKTISVIDNGYSVTYVTISGSGGKLTVDSMFLRTYYRVEFRDLDLTLGGSLDGWYTDNTLADEGFWGTPGYCNELRITNSRIELHGTITCFYKLTLTDCHIAEPVGGYYIPAEYIVVEESQDDDPGKGKLVGGNMVDPTGKHDYILILPDNAPETTTTTTTETTTTTTGTTTTTAAETTAETTSAEASKYFAPITEMGRMAEIDYMQKHGSAPAKFETEEPEDGTVRITLSDADGNVLDTYTLDPETGIGTDSTGREVNLPQTGNNSPAQAAAAAAAAGLTLAGAFLLICACRRKEDIL